MLQKAVPPGPKGTLVFGVAKSLAERPLPTLIDYAERYGDVVRYRVLKWWIYQLTRPEHVKYVLQDNVKNYTKQTAGYVRMRLFLLGEGLVTSEGELWKRQRRIIQPAFHKQRLQAMAASMVRATAEMCERWQPGKINVADELVHLTLRIVGETMLGTDVSKDVETVARCFPALNVGVWERMVSPVALPLWMPTASNRRYAGWLRMMDELVYRIIAERRRTPGESDMISMLLAARDEETGEGMSDRQLRDETITMFLAGHETTATALTWTLYLVGKHPEVERKLRAELDEVLGGRAAGFADLERLRYTRMVIEEAMRLYPPVWAASRMVMEDDQVGGFEISAGSMIMLSSYLTHRHPTTWERPEAFDPERFAPERAASIPKFGYWPFLGGPRQCIGNQFAMMEGQLLLATILQRHRLELVSEKVELETYLTLRPKGGLPMVVRPA
jgi:cytochrome P450